MPASKLIARLFGRTALKLDLRKRLNEWSRWDSLRKLGSSPLVRSSLAFAAAGYLLLWNAKFQDYLTIKFDTHLSPWPLWRIWMVYYGGFCLAVATGLYSCFCPKPIKDHATAFDLAQSECRHIVVMGIGPKYLADVEELEARCTPAERALWPPDRPSNDSLSYKVCSCLESASCIARTRELMRATPSTR
jgi:hypothetical protein